MDLSRAVHKMVFRLYVKNFKKMAKNSLYLVVALSFSCTFKLCARRSVFASFDLPEKRIAVIIPSYNNEKWVEKNLDSVRTQNYNNWYAIFIDDCSKDQTFAQAVAYVDKHSLYDKIMLIHNHRRCYKAANIYRAIHMCSDDDIVLILDGDDCWIDAGVFQYYNSRYSCENIWITAGGYIEWPIRRVGFCRPIPREVVQKNAFREYPRTTSQSRSFYAWLFKQLKLEDLFYKGGFFRTASDVAKMMPMFEMASERIGFNYRPVYLYNLSNPINDHKVDANLQEESCKDVLRRERYTRLDGPRSNKEENITQSNTDIIMITDNTLDVVEKKIKHMQAYISDIKGIMILTHNKLLRKENFQIELPIKIAVIEKEDNILSQISSHIDDLTDYILLVNDSCMFRRKHILKKYICALEKTSAFVFYIQEFTTEDAHQTQFENIQYDEIYAWQFDYAHDKWRNFPSNQAIYRKKDFLQLVSTCNAMTIQSLQNAFELFPVNERAIGLCINDQYKKEYEFI